MPERISLSELVEDLSIYPRGAVDNVRVDDLCYALDAGNVLPPPLVDRATRKIVDGFHRVRAYRKRLGDDGVIDAELEDFASDAEMLLRSAQLNAVHGKPLGRYDQRNVYLRVQQLGASNAEIASALRVTPARLLQFSIKVADSSTGQVALKRGTEHMSGRYLTDEQVAEIRRMRGAPIRAKATELARLISQGLAPVDSDPELRTALAELAAVVSTVLQPFMQEQI